MNYQEADAKLQGRCKDRRKLENNTYLQRDRYRTALRSDKDYREKIWRTVTKPLYFRDLVDDGMFLQTTTDVRYHQTGFLPSGAAHFELVRFFRERYIDLDIYTAVMSLGQDALDELGPTEEQQKEMWQWVRMWENNVIRAAVHHKLITPRRNLADLLGLNAVLDEDDDPTLARRE